MHALHLLRHAKSSWAEDRLDDHDRPLSKRGRRDAEAMARDLAARGETPDLVLSSTAARARATLAPLLERLKPKRVLLDRDLYLSPGRALLEYLRKSDEDVGCVLLVGHNPGLHELALMLRGPESPVELPPLSGKFPTGALASFRFATAWDRLKPRTAMLIAYVTPRELAEDRN
ncbi:MAG TPA: histidine phosphatase family protein [Stellaceae bacterium]|jgi:phosphohistidine phosphatase|nr:histidine phosphatase family protein [Stellaceae bacterium]